MTDGRDVIADLLMIARDLEVLATAAYYRGDSTSTVGEMEDIADRIKGILRGSRAN